MAEETKQVISHLGYEGEIYDIYDAKAHDELANRYTKDEIDDKFANLPSDGGSGESYDDTEIRQLITNINAEIEELKKKEPTGDVEIPEGKSILFTVFSYDEPSENAIELSDNATNIQYNQNWWPSIQFDRGTTIPTTYLYLGNYIYYCLVDTDKVNQIKSIDVNQPFGALLRIEQTIKPKVIIANRGNYKLINPEKLDLSECEVFDCYFDFTDPNDYAKIIQSNPQNIRYFNVQYNYQYDSNNTTGIVDMTGWRIANDCFQINLGFKDYSCNTIDCSNWNINACKLCFSTYNSIWSDMYNLLYADNMTIDWDSETRGCVGPFLGIYKVRCSTATMNAFKALTPDNWDYFNNELFSSTKIGSYKYPELYDWCLTDWTGEEPEPITLLKFTSDVAGGKIYFKKSNSYVSNQDIVAGVNEFKYFDELLEDGYEYNFCIEPYLAETNLVFTENSDKLSYIELSDSCICQTVDTKALTCNVRRMCNIVNFVKYPETQTQVYMTFNFNQNIVYCSTAMMNDAINCGYWYSDEWVGAEDSTCKYRIYDYSENESYGGRNIINKDPNDWDSSKSVIVTVVDKNGTTFTDENIILNVCFGNENGMYGHDLIITTNPSQINFGTQTGDYYFVVNDWYNNYGIEVENKFIGDTNFTINPDSPAITQITITLNFEYNIQTYNLNVSAPNMPLTLGDNYRLLAMFINNTYNIPLKNDTFNSLNKPSSFDLMYYSDYDGGQCFVIYSLDDNNYDGNTLNFVINDSITKRYEAISAITAKSIGGSFGVQTNIYVAINGSEYGFVEYVYVNVDAWNGTEDRTFDLVYTYQDGGTVTIHVNQTCAANDPKTLEMTGTGSFTYLDSNDEEQTATLPYSTTSNDRMTLQKFTGSGEVTMRVSDENRDIVIFNYSNTGFFEGNKELTVVDLGDAWHNVYEYGNNSRWSQLFKNCTNLTKVILGTNTDTNGYYKNDMFLGTNLKTIVCSYNEFSDLIRGQNDESMMPWANGSKETYTAGPVGSGANYELYDWDSYNENIPNKNWWNYDGGEETPDTPTVTTNYTIEQVSDDGSAIEYKVIPKFTNLSSHLYLIEIPFNIDSSQATTFNVSLATNNGNQYCKAYIKYGAGDVLKNTDDTSQTIYAGVCGNEHGNQLATDLLGSSTTIEYKGTDRSSDVWLTYNYDVQTMLDNSITTNLTLVLTKSDGFQGEYYHISLPYGITLGDGFVFYYDHNAANSKTSSPTVYHYDDNAATISGQWIQTDKSGNSISLDKVVIPNNVTPNRIYANFGGATKYLISDSPKNRYVYKVDNNSNEGIEIGPVTNYYNI